MQILLLKNNIINLQNTDLKKRQHKILRSFMTEQTISAMFYTQLSKNKCGIIIKKQFASFWTV
jgi:hypothetical protein